MICDAEKTGAVNLGYGMKYLIIRVVATLLFVCSGLASAQIINPVLIQSVAGTVARTDLDRARDFVSAKDFGAVCNGIADDTPKIQAALDTGRNVFIPRVSNTATMYCKLTAQLSLSSNQRIYGEGDASILRQTAKNQVVIDANGVKGCAVDGIKLYAVGSMSATIDGTGVRIRGSSARCIVQRVTVTNHRGYGVLVFNSSDNSITANTFTNSPLINTDTHNQAGGDVGILGNSSRNIVSGNHCISGNGLGVMVQTITSGDVANENIISANSIANPKQYGIAVYKMNAADSALNNVISKNVIRNVTGAVAQQTLGYIYGSGIYVQGAEDTIVVDNDIHGTHTASVTFLETLAPGAIGGTNVTRVSVTGNTIQDARMYGITLRDPSKSGASIGYAVIANNTLLTVAKTAIQAYERGKVRIAGNAINAGSESGIYVQNTSMQRGGVSVTDNSIHAVKNAGILVSFSRDVAIVGNMIDTAGTHGIYASDAPNLTVSRNNIVNFTVYGIGIDSGSSGIVADNNITGTGSSTYGIGLFSKMKTGRDNRIGGVVTDWVGDYATFKSAAPPAGTWAVGDIVWHSAHAASGNIGWVNTSAGTPGKWKAFGTIAP